MAKVSEISQAYDQEIYLSGVERSIRLNLFEYKLRIATGQTAQAVDAVSKGNCQQYTALLDGRDALDQQALANGQAFLGVVAAESQQRKAALRAAVLTEQSGVIVDKVSADNLAIAVSAQLPQKTSISVPTNGGVVPNGN